MAIDNDIENLRRIPVFAVIETEALRALSFRAETRLMRAGDHLFRKGEVSDGGFILVAGSIALGTHDDGRPAEKIVKPWALLGEVALVAQTTRPVAAIALEPTTVLKISRALFHHVLEQHPASAARVRQFFKTRLAEFSQRLKAKA
jgi:CRP-like cAMP-binding protein